MKATAGVGEPWYTSGVHEWNGTAATLKPKPTMQQGDAGEQQPAARAVVGRRRPTPAGTSAMPARLVVPVAP